MPDGTKTFKDRELDLESRFMEHALFEQRRLIDAQVGLLGTLHDRAQQLIRLNVAVFAGSIAARFGG